MVTKMCIPVLISESYYEIKNVNTISETHNILLLNPVVVDAGWFNSLPEEYQTILMEPAMRQAAPARKRCLVSLRKKQNRSVLTRV